MWCATEKEMEEYCRGSVFCVGTRHGLARWFEKPDNVELRHHHTIHPACTPRFLSIGKSARALLSSWLMHFVQDSFLKT